MRQDRQDRLDGSCTGRTALVLPALDPGPALTELLEQLGTMWRGPVVVVDDGSGGQARAIFARAGQLGATVLHHGQNLGKGAALKTAFRYCRTAWPELAGCVTADADGQHTARDIVRTAQALCRHPHSLVLGVRDFSAAGVPARSRLGNRLTRGAMALVCGIRLGDTQTGLRGIPMSFLPRALDTPGTRYEYETALLLTARQAGLDFVQLPVATVYADGNRGSHFRPLADGLRVWGCLAGPFLRFAGASLACTAVDLGLFTVLAGLLRPLGGWYPAAATVGARVVSAGCNFALNRALVFRLRHGTGRAAWRYGLLCAGQAAASALLTTLLAWALPWPDTLCKVPVDTALFFAGYTIQRRWVFAAGEEEVR